MWRGHLPPGSVQLYITGSNFLALSQKIAVGSTAGLNLKSCFALYYPFGLEHVFLGV